ncbi:hypothetical protein SH668x_001567 [Planctomicrobium sp. SH668]|uniref:hypothetical protein n=1 Tax=Planctomicrobium sp. SH668 TaxID=3448126 RepID=UPI003F5B9BE8
MPTRIFTLILAAILNWSAVSALADGEPATSVPPAAAVPLDLENLQHLFVPSRELGVIFEQDRPGAVMPLAEFNELLEKAKSTQSDPGVPPLPSVTSKAHYQCNLDGDVLNAVVEVEIRTLVPHQTCDLQVGKWQISSARIGDEQAIVTRTGEGLKDLRVFFATPGKHVVRLEMSTNMMSKGNSQVRSVSLIQAAASSFEVTIPAQRSLIVNQRELKRPAENNLPATYQLAVGKWKEMELLVTTSEKLSTTDSLTFASTAYGLRVEPGEISWTARTLLQVYGQQIDRLVCWIPHSLEITHVDSPGLDSWELADDPEKPEHFKLTLHFNLGFKGDREIQFKGVTSNNPGEPWRVADLVIAEVTSHVGIVSVGHSPAVRIQTQVETGVRPAIPTPQLVERAVEFGPEHLFFEVWQQDFDLQFTTSLKDQRVQAAITNLLSIETEGLRLSTIVSLQTQQIPLFEARVVVPADFQMTSALRDGSPILWEVIPSDAGQNEIRLKLDPTLTPGQSTTLMLTLQNLPTGWPVEATPITVGIPVIRMPITDMVEGQLVVASPAELDVVPQNLVGLHPASQNELNALQLKLQESGQTLRQGFNYQNTEYQGQLQISRKQTLFTTRSLIFFRVDRESVFTRLESTLNLTGGGLRELTLQLSESAPLSTRFLLSVGSAGTEAAQIVEQLPGEVANGMRSWVLKFDRHLQGEYLLTTQVELNRGSEATFSPVKILFPQANAQIGFLAIEGPTDEQVSIVAQSQTGQALVPVDPVDFPKGRYQPRERVVAGFQSPRPDWNVTLSTTQFAREAIPGAIAQTAMIKSVLGAGGEFQTHATYSFTAFGMQSLLIELPEAAVLWSTKLDQQTIEARKMGNRVQIPLAGLNPQQQHELTVIYSVDGLPLQERGEIRAVPPLLLCISGDGKTQPLPVMGHQWTLHYPDDTILIHSAGRFSPRTGAWDQTWLQTLSHLQFAPRLSRISSGIGLLIGALLIWGAVAFRRRSRVILMGTAFVAIVIMIVAPAVWIVSRIQNPRMSLSRPIPATPFEIDQSKNSDVSLFERKDQPQPGFPMVEKPAASSPVPAAQPTDGTDSDGTDSMGSAIRSEQSDADISAVPYSRNPITFERNSPSGPPSPDDGPSVSQSDLAPGSGFVAPADKSGVDQLARNRFSTGGLLSMNLDLEVPLNTKSKEFQYYGNSAGGQPVDLQVAYANRTTCEMLFFLIISGSVLLGWWIRRTSWRVKSLFLFFFVVLPVSLLGIVNLGVAIVLQGFIIGGLLSLLIWGLFSCVQCCSNLRVDSGRIARGFLGARLWIAGLAMVSGASGVMAQDVVPPASVPFVVIPYESIDQIPDANRVYVPAALYKQLWEAAHPEDQTPADPAVACVIVDADHNLTFEPQGDLHNLAATSRFVVMNFTSRPQTVRFPLQTNRLQEVLVDGEPALLKSLDDQSTGVVIPTAGIHIVDAKAMLKGNVKVQQDLCEFVTIPGIIGRCVIEFPFDRPDFTLTVASGQIGVQKKIEDGKLQFSFPVDSDLVLRNGLSVINLAWADQNDAPDKSAKFQSVTNIETLIEDAGIRQFYRVTLKLRSSGEFSPRFKIPDGLGIREISGDNIDNWVIETADGERYLKINLNTAVVSAGTTLTVNLECYQSHLLPPEGGAMDLRFATLLQAEYESGQVAVAAADSLRLRLAESQNLQQIDVIQLDSLKEGGVQKFSQNPQLAFKFNAQPIALRFDVTRRDAELQATIEHGVNIGRRKTTIASRILLNLTVAPQRLLQFEIPEGYLTMDVVCPNAIDWYVIKSSGKSRLVIELNQPQLGTIEIGLEGHLIKNPQDPSFTVDLPRPLGANRFARSVGVWVDELYQPSLRQAGNWRSVNQTQLPETIRQLRPLPPQFAFQSNEGTTPLEFQLNRNAPEFVADAGVLMAVGDFTVDYGLTLQWKISNAAADQFIFNVPSWLGNLEFTGPGIRQIQSEAIDGGRTRWTISLIDAVRDQYLITAAATIASPTDLTVRTPRIEFETLSEVGVSTVLGTQRQFAVLVNLSQQQLSPVDVSQIESVTPEQLSLAMSPQLVQQAMQIVRVRDDKVPAWTIQQMEQAVGAQAIIPSCSLTTVLQMDGSWRTQAIYGVRNRGRQFMAIQIPSGSELLSVFVREQPARAVVTTLGAETIHLIALPQTSAADLSFDVKIQIAGQLDEWLPRPRNLLGRKLSIPVPRVVTTAESPEYGLTVAQTIWSVHVPDELDAYPVERKGMTNVTFHRGEGTSLIVDQSLNRLVSDIAEMKRIVVDQRTTWTRRQQVQLNLVELQEKLDSYSSFGSASYEEAAEHNYFNGSLYGKKLSDARKELESIEVDNERKLNEANTHQSVTKSFQQGNRAFIEINNGILMQANTLQQGQLGSGRDEPTLNFYQSGDARRQSGIGKKSQEESESRSRLKSQIQSQQYLGIETKSLREEYSDQLAYPNQDSAQKEMQQQSNQQNWNGSDGMPLSGDMAGAMGGMGAMSLGGGMGGGMGGYGIPGRDGAMNEGPSNTPVSDSSPGERGARTTVALPTSSQGLSVALSLPVTGQELTFSKPGGNPELILSVRPKQAITFAYGAVWGAVALIVGICLLRYLFRNPTWWKFANAFCFLGVVIGVIGFLYLPAELWLLGVFVIAVSLLVKLYVSLADKSSTVVPSP